MQNSNNKISFATTTTKAIQCEVLPSYPVNNSNSWKFITPHRLQKAIKEAKYDLQHMLSKPEGVNYPVGASTFPKKVIIKDVISTLPNLSQDYIGIEIKAKPITKQKNHTPCYQCLQFYEKNTDIEPESHVSQNSIVRTSMSVLQREVHNNKALNEEDLKWLGKNYSTHLSRKAVFNNTNSKSHNFGECSLPPVYATMTSKNQNKIPETVVDLINRVQMREQQLWKQLAEMSFISSSSISSSTVENVEWIPSHLPTEQNISIEVTNRRDCTKTASPQHSHEMRMSGENLISLLGDEWLKNLLMEELEISDLG